MLTEGDITEGYGVLHRCDNPPCVNPAHLWIGTDADNMRDRDQKGRMVSNIKHFRPEMRPRGEKHGHAKLTAEQVQTIRALHGTMPQHAIAKHFGVDRSTISEIQSGKKWRHLLKTDEERQS
jgi:DNA invertase Pin-like site-specific DNA recombinase